MGSTTARHDIKLLRDAVASLPAPALSALQGGLRILEQVDLRAQLGNSKPPVFGCFGRLDTLVPATVLEPLQQLLPQAQFTLFAKASHAPFISHPSEFSDWLLQHLAPHMPTICKE
jgi:pimeloyl-[acyl-carrier protein] methyl ester esterase